LQNNYNSLKFTKTGSIPEIDINAKEVNDSGISVQDNGIGIDQKKHKQSFQDIQTSSQPRDQYEGTGIGLSHCEKIMDLHGDKIWIDSKLERKYIQFHNSQKNKRSIIAYI
jgi:signal transduction histidine kinase